MRRDVECVNLTDFKIATVRQITVARAEAIVFLSGKTMNRSVGGNFKLLAFFNGSDKLGVLPSEDGRWQVQQNCIFDLMHERVTEEIR